MSESSAEDFSTDAARLLIPLLESQLTDLRSALVREACKALEAVSMAVGDGARPLVKALLPSLIDVAACANKVISGYADDCVRSLLQNTHVRRAIPRIVKLIRSSKSKGVRNNCAEYLLLVLRHWERDYLARVLTSLTKGIRFAIEDASAPTRATGRQCWIAFSELWPERAFKERQLYDFRTQSLLEREAAAALTPSRRRMSVEDKAAAAIQAIVRGHKTRKKKLKPALKTLTIVEEEGEDDDDDAADSGTAAASSSSSSSTRARKQRKAKPSRSPRTSPGSGRATAAASHRRSPRSPALSPPSRVPTSHSRSPRGDAASSWFPAVSDRVIVHRKGEQLPGTVRYIGELQSYRGTFFGVELDEATGKHDGAFKGKRYFRCPASCGVFARISQLSPLEEEAAAAAGEDALALDSIAVEERADGDSRPAAAAAAATAAAAAAAAAAAVASSTSDASRSRRRSSSSSSPAAAAVTRRKPTASPRGTSSRAMADEDDVRTALACHRSHIDEVFALLAEELRVVADMEDALLAAPAGMTADRLESYVTMTSEAVGKRQRASTALQAQLALFSK
eukprot:PLAT6649.1.p1 GENE.PLAT6649.1~~PLAT6649.1.p1  ORF type:complete len:609 (-),score=252.90 PLAT6649.1:75-1778(-)